MPMLIGKRVTLRAIEKEDLPSLHRFNNDLEVELAGGGDPPMPQSMAQLQSLNASMDDKHRSNWFAIEFEGRCIGACGFHNEDPVARTTEFGIGIGEKELWSRGLGREAVQLLLKYGFHYHNYRKLWLRVWGDNERAIKAYLACGFKEEGRLRAHVWSNGDYRDAVYMGLLRDEWKETQ
jgi:RimJ/RimL family protein N-acetyltransferase